MNNQLVANQMGVSRQAIHKSLSSSIPKVFDLYKRLYQSNDYDTFIELITGMNIVDEKDTKDFYRYLREDQKEEIKKDKRAKI